MPNAFPPQHDIRIGTLVQGNSNPASYIRQIRPYGFESFSITFWQTLGEANLQEMAAQVRDTLDGAAIGCLNIFGNPLGSKPEDLLSLQGWESLIDHAHLFGTDIVAGFSGRVRERSIPDSIPRFKEVFGPLAQRAQDKGIRLAFENCSMGGTWESGDWNIAHNPDAWELMFDALPNENLGLQWEPAHQMDKLIDPLPQLRQWVRKVFHLHGKCATVKWDIIRRHGIAGGHQFAWHRTPGFGDCNWADIITELRAGGFTGSIDIEGWHDPVYRDDLEMTGQVHGLNYLKRCRGGDFLPNPT